MPLSVKSYVCIFRKGCHSVAVLNVAFVARIKVALPPHPSVLRQALSLLPKLAWTSHPPASAFSGARAYKPMLPHPTRPFNRDWFPPDILGGSHV